MPLLIISFSRLWGTGAGSLGRIGLPLQGQIASRLHSRRGFLRAKMEKNYSIDFQRNHWNSVDPSSFGPSTNIRTGWGAQVHIFLKKLTGHARRCWPYFCIGSGSRIVRHKHLGLASQGVPQQFLEPQGVPLGCLSWILVDRLWNQDLLCFRSRGCLTIGLMRLRRLRLRSWLLFFQSSHRSCFSVRGFTTSDCKRK